MFDRGGERWNAGEDLFELLCVVGIQPVGVPSDPSGHVSDGGLATGRCLARERFAELVDITADDLFLTGVSALPDLFEQVPCDCAALGVALVEIWLVGVEDAHAAGPLADQQFIGIPRAGESSDGVASQPEPAGDGAQADAILDQGMNGGVVFADPVRQPS